MMASKSGAMGAEPWDTEWAAERASEALHYLARNYPECAASAALREHEEAAHEAGLLHEETVVDGEMSLDEAAARSNGSTNGAAPADERSRPAGPPPRASAPTGSSRSRTRRRCARRWTGSPRRT